MGIVRTGRHTLRANVLSISSSDAVVLQVWQRQEELGGGAVDDPELDAEPGGGVVWVDASAVCFVPFKLATSSATLPTTASAPDGSPSLSFLFSMSNASSVSAVGFPHQ